MQTISTIVPSFLILVTFPLIVSSVTEQCCFNQFKSSYFGSCESRPRGAKKHVGAKVQGTRQDGAC